MGYRNTARVACLVLAGICFQPARAQEGQNPQPTAAGQTPAPDAGNANSPSAPGSGTENATSPQAPAPLPEAKAEPSAQTEPEHPRLKRKPKKSTHTQKTHSADTAQNQNQSGKVVVRNGGASDKTPQMSLGMSQEQAQHQKETTAQLLATTDANVKRVAGHQLTPNQQSMLDQINAYTRQSKAASDAGDVNRAHTFAYKAHLLSDELVRH